MKTLPVLCLCVMMSTLVACAGNDAQAPNAPTYQVKNQPTGSDAALAAHKTY